MRHRLHGSYQKLSSEDKKIVRGESLANVAHAPTMYKFWIICFVLSITTQVYCDEQTGVPSTIVTTGHTPKLKTTQVFEEKSETLLNNEETLLEKSTVTTRRVRRKSTTVEEIEITTKKEHQKEERSTTADQPIEIPDNVEIVQPFEGDSFEELNKKVVISYGCPVNRTLPCIPKCCNLSEIHTRQPGNNATCIPRETTTPDFLVDFADFPVSEQNSSIDIRDRYEYYIGVPCIDGK